MPEADANRVHGVEPGYNKIAAGGGTGIILVPILVWIYEEATGKIMPGEVAAAFAGVVSSLFFFFTSERFFWKRD